MHKKPMIPKDKSTESHERKEESSKGGLSRRDLLGSAAVGVAAGALGTAGLTEALAGPPPHAGGPKDGQTILLKGGVVLTMDPDTPDMEEGDVLIQGSKIAGIGHDLGGGGLVIDCTGKIVMPGFINTHAHQYQIAQRSILADSLLGSFAPPGNDWPQEAYASLAIAIWTDGRIRTGFASPPTWDLGRSPYDPDDCYISELVASWSGIDAGITTAIDTSQSSHTPEHTDAMIQGLFDSGRRTLYDYSAGRSPAVGSDAMPGYEWPGTIGDNKNGIGRLAKEWFSSRDQLVTLGLQANNADLWALGRHYRVPMVFHGGGGAIEAAAGSDMSDLTAIHATSFDDDLWTIAGEDGLHISVAPTIEMQMGHGTPPIQEALDVDRLISLSSDVETNMTADMFTIMRTAFTLQRLLVNPSQGYDHAGKAHVTARTVLRMATVAGAAAAGLSDKVGMLSVGMEADVIVLNARAINSHPMASAEGNVVTMMDRSNVDTVIIGGQIKKRDGELVGVDVNKLLNDIEDSKDRILGRIQDADPPVPDGAHTAPGYTPNLLQSCCFQQPYPDATP